MTIAPLVQNYKKKQTVTRLKSVYSQLNQAVKFSEVENGDFANIDLSENNSFEKYIVPYLKIADKFEYGNNLIKFLTPYKQVSGATETDLLIMYSTGMIRYTLANGVDIITTNKISGLYIVDINGTNNGPNKFGKDAFCFNFKSGYNFLPSGYFSTKEYTVPDEFDAKRKFYIGKKGTILDYGCNKSCRGMFCAALIMLDGWEIKNDYPW